jgi:flagellar protein FlgJ
VKGTAEARLKDTAKEMEATFLSMLLKEMRQTLDEDGGGFFPGDTGDVLGGLFDLYLGRHMADSGGIGMAAALVDRMQPPSGPRAAPTNHAPAPAAPGPDGRPADPPRP